MQDDRRERRSVSRLIVHLVSSPNAGPVGCFAGTRQTSPLAIATCVVVTYFTASVGGARLSIISVCRATSGRRLLLTLLWRLPHPENFVTGRKPLTNSTDAQLLTGSGWRAWTTGPLTRWRTSATKESLVAFRIFPQRKTATFAPVSRHTPPKYPCRYNPASTPPMPGSR
jgi:hypothetical protein